MGLIGPGKTMLRSGPLQGSGAPTSVRTAGLPSMGFLATFGARRFPKGNEGKTQGGLPLGNPVCLWQTELFKLNLKSSPSSSGYNRRRRLATRSSGKQQAERTAVRTAPIVCPEESLLGARRRNPPFPDEGLTRRLRRGWWGCRPEGGSTFFRSERKYQRKHAARRLREKGFYCPFLRRGRNVARNEVGQLPPALGARSCSPFSAVKMGGPFSLRCLSPLCSPAVGTGQT